jgi:hypothetical protein
MIASVTTAKKLTALAVVAAAFAVAAAAQAATIMSTTPFQADVKACNGDTIHLSGQLLGVFSITVNAAGGATFASHFQPQGISGVDTHGTKYLGTGVTRDISVFAPS